MPDGHFDEMRTAAGALRQPWAEFAAATELRPEYLSEAQKRVARQIDENGVTYNVYAAADGLQRPWSLDVLPLIVKAQEWERLGRGLRQRARLLNAVATDIYGPQALLRDGLIPPALVFRHPGFLRACHGVRPPGGVFLHLVAFDLARGADGEWRVVGTRTQAPSGVGYALENRAIVSRVLPDAFHELRVQALSPFFRELRQMLFAGPGSNGGAPHVVVLTPGPYNETYFEHAYLARQLGFPLVEGGDLTVRDDRVFLKTVSGLRPRPRDSAPPRRRLLRSARNALRLDARDPGARAGVARGPCARGERVRDEHPRIAGAARVSAADLHAVVRRDRSRRRRSPPGGAARLPPSTTPAAASPKG